MPFKLSSEQEVMQKVAREYAENKIRPIAANMMRRKKRH